MLSLFAEKLEFWSNIEQENCMRINPSMLVGEQFFLFLNFLIIFIFCSEMSCNLFERWISSQDSDQEPENDDLVYNNGLDSPLSISLGDLEVARAREQDRDGDVKGRPDQGHERAEERKNEGHYDRADQQQGPQEDADGLNVVRTWQAPLNGFRDRSDYKCVFCDRAGQCSVDGNLGADFAFRKVECDLRERIVAEHQVSDCRHGYVAEGAEAKADE